MNKAMNVTYLSQPGESNILPTLQRSGLNVNALYALFINQVSFHLRWGTTWYVSRERLSPILLNVALKGEMFLGVPAISGTGTTKFTVFDLDEGKLSDLNPLLDHLPTESVLLEPSRRGGHVWFFHTPIPWQQANQFGIELIERLGLSCEVYPKGGHDHGVKLMGTRHPKSNIIYPIISGAGEVLHISEAIERVVVAEVAPIEVVEEVAVVSTEGHSELIQELMTITDVRVYADGKAIAKCCWHDDAHPSLYIKGRRFHCMSPSCSVFGDIWDVRRWKNGGIRPPH